MPSKTPLTDSWIVPMPSSDARELVHAGDCRRLELSHQALMDACVQFTAAATDAVHALNALGAPCPVSIALAAEKARHAMRAARELEKP